ncbi:MAG: LysR family transcriptional regulator [Beijerinckiaceae bacterium]|jgi:DNA-binding transcriptional LysR family regulator|nr:LysR family transcriptional regulator [Beijerinckiaceae bacterium]
MRINCEILDLKAFITILDLGNFSRAAEALNISQPALSRRLRSLEATIGTPLLERTTRHVQVSAVGRTLEPFVRRMVDEFEVTFASVSEFGLRTGGLVTIACVPTAAFYFLPRVISTFHTLYPDIRFRILDLSADPALDAVARGDADFGVNFVGASHQDLTFTPLIEDPFVLACHRKNPLAKKDKVVWADLEQIALVGVGRASGNRMLLDSMLGRHNIHLKWFYEVNHLSMSLGFVEAGLGASVLPRLATPQGNHPLIVTKPLTDPLISRTIGLVERYNGKLSPPAQRFRDLLVESWHGQLDSVSVDGKLAVSTKINAASSPAHGA